MRARVTPALPPCACFGNKQKSSDLPASGLHTGGGPPVSLPPGPPRLGSFLCSTHSTFISDSRFRHSSGHGWGPPCPCSSGPAAHPASTSVLGCFSGPCSCLGPWSPPPACPAGFWPWGVPQGLVSNPDPAHLAAVRPPCCLSCSPAKTYKSQVGSVWASRSS